MKLAKKKSRHTSEEEMVRKVERLLSERGKRALETVKTEILKERVESEKAMDALRYFVSYWRDLARPTLMSIVCEAVGGRPEEVTRMAVPLSIISGATDVHDDLIDESTSKMSRKTVLGKFGRDIALIVGDALLFQGFTLLCEEMGKGVPPEKITATTRVLKRMFFELGDAEALELDFRGRINITPEEYLNLVRKKAADVEAHTRIGAILSGASEKQIESLAKYGRLLGMIMTLRDDIIDMAHHEEFLHRIEKECLPLPVFNALQKPKAKHSIVSLLSKKHLTDEDVKRIFDIVQEAGGIEETQLLMGKLSKRAYSAIKSIQNRSYLELFVSTASLVQNVQAKPAKPTSG